MTERLWGGRRVPMTLLGGYLGAGKTTLVNHLLATAGQRLTVLVNDVGAIAVDAALLASVSDDTIELTNGCVCCSLTDGFAAALEQVRDRPAPDHLLVELSGVAEPARVAPFAATAGFSANGVVVLADVDQLVVRHVDHRTRDVVERQLAAADLVVRTKLDLASSADITAATQLIARLAPHAPIVDADRGRLASELVLGPSSRPSVVSTLPSTADPAPQHAPAVVSGTLTTREDLEAWLATAPASLVRCKGIASTADGAAWSVNLVGNRRAVRSSSDPATGLVLIGAPGTDAALTSFAGRAPLV